MADMLELGFLTTISAVSLFVGAMVFAAVMDVLTMKVSDRLVILLLAGFVILAPLSGWSLEEMAWSVAAAMMVFFASVALFSLGWLGGGDGKLATVIALWLGAQNVLPFITMTALLGGVCALGLLLFRALPLPRAWRERPWVARLHGPETGIPYAVAIGLAALIVLPKTPWLAAF